MAMQGAGPAAVLPGAQVVANAFVEQYYHILHQSPELVHKFYQDSSILSRPDTNGMMTSVTTMQAINEKIQSLDYKNYRAEIKTADAQDSYQDGVIVLVTGCLTGTDNVKRKFAQTFFLAPQEKGYFVQNDVFRYVEESAPLETTSPSVEAIIESVPAVTNEESTRVRDDNAYNPETNIEADDLNDGPEVCDPSDNEEGSGSGLEEEGVDEPAHTRLNINETSSVVRPNASAAQEEKKSYASIVKVTTITGPSVSGRVPTGSLRWAPANADQNKPRSAKPSPEPETSVPNVVNGPESSSINDEVEGHSIYVRNLPMNATEIQLEEEFKRFGTIRSNGIQVRSNKQQGYCFGFVEFESMDSMQSAIKAPAITIGNRQVVVEEKRTTTRVGSGGRVRYASGRGGGVSFRGRGGNFGGRSYGRYQGEFQSRSKGRNLETYQRVDQNGGPTFTPQSNKNTQSAD